MSLLRTGATTSIRMKSSSSMSSSALRRLVARPQLRSSPSPFSSRFSPSSSSRSSSSTVVVTTTYYNSNNGNSSRDPRRQQRNTNNDYQRKQRQQQQQLLVPQLLPAAAVGTVVAAGIGSLVATGGSPGLRRGESDSDDVDDASSAIIDVTPLPKTPEELREEEATRRAERDLLRAFDERLTKRELERRRAAGTTTKDE